MLISPAFTNGKKIFDNSDQPTEVEFQINKFTTQEWPMQELEPLDDFSIGQEQSLSNVTQLSWSPAGYTKYLHPILAVLTSNCVLSLWASSSDPYDSATWERVLVVNNVIHASLQQQGLTSNSQSRAKLRLRNMSWSPPRYVNQDMSTLDGRTLSSLGATKTLPHLYFAVINEADEALIIQGDNPYADSDTSGGRNNPTWAATILKSGTWGQIQGFSQEQEASQPTTQPGIHSGFSAFGLSMQRTRVLDNISWGPWNESGNETLLTLRRAGRISHHVLHLADDTSSAEFLSPQQGESLSIEEDSQVTILSPIYGPATWFQKVFLPSMTYEIQA